MQLLLYLITSLLRCNGARNEILDASMFFMKYIGQALIFFVYFYGLPL